MSLGAEGMTISDLADVERLAVRLEQPLKGVLLVDCRITTNVRADFVTAHCSFGELNPMGGYC